MTTVAAGFVTTVDADVPCVGCRYNLRTLPLTASCPECGASVEKSLLIFHRDREELGKLRENGLPWLRSIRAGIVMALLAWVASAGGAAFGIRSLRQPVGMETFGRAVFYFFVYLLGAIATWKLMAFRRRRKSLAIGRLAIIAAVTGLAAIYASVLAVGPSEPASALRVFAVLWPFLITASFGRITQVAWLCGLRVQSVALGMIGLASALMATLVAGAILNSDAADYAQAISLLPGPTAAWPMLWTVSAELVGASAARVDVIVTVAVLIAYCGLGVMLNSLRLDLSRAIRLSESPAASSPPSPSLHLPH